MRNRPIALLIALALVTAGCGSDDDGGDASGDAKEPKLTISAPKAGEKVEGNVVELFFGVTGLEIVKADGDTSGKTGHLHVFVDKEPVAVGETIPDEPGVIHTIDNPVAVPGLTQGEHTLTVVAGDGAHRRIAGLVDSVKVTVEGPTVKATGPASGTAGQPISFDLAVEGVRLTPATQDNPPTDQTGHLHAFIDVDPSMVAPGSAIPAEPGKIIHFADTKFTTPPLPAGEHTIWFVLGNGAHVAWDPPVRDRVKITVT